MLKTAPRPVVTPQPMSAAISYGTSSGIGTAQPAPTTTSSVKVPVPAKPKTSPPGRLKLGVPAFMNPVRQSWLWPRLQDGHVPQAGSQQTRTRSPWASPSTPSPTSTISPAPSWPGTKGAGWGSTPFIAETSEWQSPVALMRILTLPGPKPTASTSSKTSSLSCPISCCTAARMVRLLTQGAYGCGRLLGVRADVRTRVLDGGAEGLRAAAYSRARRRRERPLRVRRTRRRCPRGPARRRVRRR